MELAKIIAGIIAVDLRSCLGKKGNMYVHNVNFLYFQIKRLHNNVNSVYSVELNLSFLHW